jgi:hypothetical protein
MNASCWQVSIVIVSHGEFVVEESKSVGSLHGVCSLLANL